MKKARLEDIGIEIPLRWNQFYHDDGYVDSVEEHRKSLAIKYTGFYINEFFENVPERFGECMTTSKGFLFFVHVYYLNTGSEKLNCFFKGHEKTHASDNLGGLDLLSEKILEDEKMRINLYDIRKKYGEEVTASIGGICAISRKGIHVEKVKTELLNLVGKDSDAYKRFEKAAEVWNESKLSKKNYSSI